MRDEGVVLPPSFGRRGLRFPPDKHILLKPAEFIELAAPYSPISGYYEKDYS